MGTTFSLNLDAALTAPAAFALYAAADMRDPHEVEPLGLLDSIRRHAGRFTVFFQSGQVAVPAQRRLFAYLEGALVPVTAPGGGIFHPKVWVLRFEADERPPTYRVLCASRNLTHDRAWDTMLRLDALEGSGAATSLIDPSGLATFVRRLPELAVGGLSEDRRTDILQLADEIATVRWSAPAGIRQGRFLPLGLGGESNPPFPASADQIAVISPFLTTGLLQRLPKSTGRTTLVSRPDQMVACAKTAAITFGEAFTLDPNAIPVGGSSEGASSDDSARVSQEDPAIRFEGLHAKTFVFDHGATTTLLTGSANATSAAFGSNVEFLTELICDRKLFGVDALMKEPTKDVQTLRSFLIPFDLGDPANLTDLTGPVEEELDVLRRQIATLPVVARAIRDGSDDRFKLSFTSADQLPALPDGVSWRCWPISDADNAGHAVESAGQLDETFPVSFEGITAFLANELSIGEISTRFVLAAELREAPENRATRLLRILLGDAERFLRYLLMLLSDDALDQYGLTDLLDALDDEGGKRWKTAPDSVPLLEALLRTLARDPERLDHIQNLITDLQADPDGPSILPDGLLEIWDPIWAVAQVTRR